MKTIITLALLTVLIGCTTKSESSVDELASCAPTHHHKATLTVRSCKN